ncbi:hypothetical protein [Burkholderia contaminans]|uniref:hypothetical protein n=1 Tax=Burkholderia contaminans TaxID=488447 RepID=UPI00158EE5FE|nr:hypothetical protein [Burkholderia contaminans]
MEIILVERTLTHLHIIDEIVGALLARLEDGLLSGIGIRPVTSLNPLHAITWQDGVVA